MSDDTMVSKYDLALKLMKGKKPSRKVYDLLFKADTSGDARATYALATWYLHGTRITKRDVPRAIAMLKEAAGKNVKEALFDLAVSYERGNGVKKSVRKAFILYVRAALLGDAQSYYEVGRMYYRGFGVTKNKELAEIWLSKAEALGITE